MLKSKKTKSAPEAGETKTIKTKKASTATLHKLEEKSNAKKEEKEGKKIKKVPGEEKETKKVKKVKHEKAERASIYNYPDGIDADAKKNFRAKARKGIKNFEKKLRLANKGKGDQDAKVIQKEFNAFKKEHYLGEVPAGE